MSLYQNVVPEYEEYMLDTEYDRISSHTDAAYEYVRPQITESLQRKNEIRRPPSCGAYMLLGCVIGLLIGAILGVATTLLVMQHNEGQKSIISDLNDGAYAYEAASPNRAVKVDTSPSVATSESLFSTKYVVTAKSTQYASPINTEETIQSSDFSFEEGTPSTRYAGSTAKPGDKSEEDEGTTIVTTSQPPITHKGRVARAKAQNSSSRHTKTEFPCEVRVGAMCYSIEVRGGDIMDFGMARSTCQTLGGAVARIPSEGAYNAITEKMRTLNPHRNRWVTAWIGLQIDPKTGTPSPQGSKEYLKWGPDEPNIGEKFFRRTHVYIYVDKYDLKYVGMRNFSPDWKRNGVICQDEA